MIPDLAWVYFILRRSYIETHWQVDPVTKVIYFPLDFYWADEKGKTVVPAHFFMLNQNNQISVGPVEHEVTQPNCPGAIYTADRMDGKIYFLRTYTMSVDATVFPCLITPTLNSKPPPP